MKNLLIALLTLITTFATAQTTAIWVGGTPGKETKWNEAKNWSNYRVPDEFSNVIIKNNNSGHQAQPVISGVVEVSSIEIQASACLTISDDGEIIIDGTGFYSKGISNYGGNLVNEGVIDLRNIDRVTASHFEGKIQGKGMVLVNEGWALFIFD